MALVRVPDAVAACSSAQNTYALAVMLCTAVSFKRSAQLSSKSHCHNTCCGSKLKQLRCGGIPAQTRRPDHRQMHHLPLHGQGNTQHSRRASLTGRTMPGWAQCHMHCPATQASHSQQHMGHHAVQRGHAPWQRAGRWW